VRQASDSAAVLRRCFMGAAWHIWADWELTAGCRRR
jgi:hypothetical protein